MLNVAVDNPLHLLDGFGTETWFDKYYCRADVTSLFGEVEGLKLLDAGCGYGADSCELEKAGALVTALDIDKAALDFVKGRSSSNLLSVEADLRQPIPLLDDEYDGVLASLVLHYLEDWDVPLQSFHRVLKTGGRLISSVHHPAADSQDAESKNYFSRESWEGTDCFGKKHTFWRRPLEEMVGEIQRFGFALEKLIEPKPNANLFYESRQDYEELISVPRYIVISATKI
jgi:SAM-dependent methyltransferase